MDTVRVVHVAIDSSKDTVSQRSIKSMNVKKDTVKLEEKALEQRPILPPEEMNSRRKRGPDQKPRDLEKMTGQ